MDEEQSKQVLAGKVAEVLPQLAGFSRADLVTLQAGEVAGQNRTSLLAAIDKQLAAIDDADESAPQNHGEGSGTGKASGVADAAPAPPAEPPAWQAPDYHGALTAEQADWRVHHIKPAAGGALK